MSTSYWKIPLFDLDYGMEEIDAVTRVLKSKWLSMGPEVEAFEAEFAREMGVKHAIVVPNASAALHLAFLCVGARDGAEILQPAMNFVAAANMTRAVRAEPVFADIISLDEPTVSPEEIRRKISPRTKAVVVMHYGGYLSRMAEISEICKEHSIPLIEDACHAIGARYCDSQNFRERSFERRRWISKALPGSRLHFREERLFPRDVSIFSRIGLLFDLIAGPRMDCAQWRSCSSFL